MSFWRQNWWVIAFSLFIFFAHFHFIAAKKEAVSQISLRLKEMEQEKIDELKRKEELELCLASQSDPAWIEMVLIRDLGVVPEGFLKVHFKR